MGQSIKSIFFFVCAIFLSLTQVRAQKSQSQMSDQVRTAEKAHSEINL